MKAKSPHFLKRIQTRVRLAELYGVDKDTITAWLRRIGITHRASLTPIELELINQKIGTPEQLNRLHELFNKK